MYDDDQQSGSYGFLKDEARHYKPRIGISFQADLPDFSKEDYEAESKWTMYKTWPSENTDLDNSINSPIGKGRPEEPCTCRFPGSPGCVHFHIRSKRTKLRDELGRAFSKWRFNDAMGEDAVKTLWSKPHMDKFQEIGDKCRGPKRKFLWRDLFKAFPDKGQEVLVRYYFNVFIIQRRSKQNRSNGALPIDTDDEDNARKRRRTA